MLLLIGAATVLGLGFYLQHGSSNKVTTTDDWRKYDGLFKQFGTLYGVPWTHLKAICLNESDLGRVASVRRGLASPTDTEGSKSSDGKSWGLMQVTLTTAKGMDPQATAAKLNEPHYSVRLGAQYVSQLQKMYSRLEPNYLEWVIKSYNQGPGNTKKEKSGAIKGYAQEYWNRFQRNLMRVEETL